MSVKFFLQLGPHNWEVTVPNEAAAKEFSASLPGLCSTVVTQAKRRRGPWSQAFSTEVRLFRIPNADWLQPLLEGQPLLVNRSPPANDEQDDRDSLADPELDPDDE